ncbi:MAG TPA: molybdate ABC transporter substrate-binding protein [Candidatus Dormibacteraeota bacterium]|nr:molybdate ABC transporter substrate-binding protein [Candidatus Dormibacteraeota bacterium]
MVRGRAVAASASIAVLFSACGSTAPASQNPSALSGSITVFAASSLTAAFTTTAADFQKIHPGTMVKLTFAGSSTLVAQIQQGAIGDLFASADQPNMQKLVDAGLIAGSRSIFAHNSLQIVVGAGNPKHITALADLSRSGLVVLLCAPGVPCGRYAAQALQKAGVSVTPASQEADVKAVVSKVALGEADAGIVYVTDVKAGAGVQGVNIPPALNVVADYPVAVLKDSQNVPLAEAFVSYLLADGQRTLARYGFTSP